MTFLFVFMVTRSWGQTSLAESNPGEWAAITTGESYLMNVIGQQTGLRTATTTEMGGMMLATNTMKKWQKHYIEYLKKGYTLADQVLATCDIYMNALNTFKKIHDISKAISINPQGPFATMGMNNIYVEVGTQFIECYKMINEVKSRAEDNLMNGSERARLLWKASEMIQNLNNKLNQLCISICCYNFEDVWNRATMGMAQKTHSQLAKEARDRFQRAIRNQSKVYMSKK